MKKLALLAAAAAIVFCLVLRSLRPGDMPFLGDEPLLQLIVDKFLRERTIPFTGLRGSNIPFPYGGGALWVYALLRTVAHTPEGLVSWHILFYSAGLLSLRWLLRGIAKIETILLITWLAVSSPYFFFFSRMLWDNTFVMPLSAAVLACVLRLESCPRAFGCWALLGLLAAWMINIHLMAGPFLVAAGLTALVICRRAGKSWAGPSLALGVFALGIAPYFYAAIPLFRAFVPDSARPATHPWGDGRNLWWLVQRSLLFLSNWRAKVFFSESYASFEAFTGPGLSALFRIDILGWVLKLVALGAICATPFRWKKGMRPGALEILACTAFFLHVLILNFLNISTEPHYFQPIWWLGFVALAIGIEKCKGMPRRAILCAVGGVACLNTLYLGHAFTFIRQNHGMPNYTYGSTAEEERKAISEACQSEPGPIKIATGAVQIMHAPLLYFSGHLPECAGKELVFTDEKNASLILTYREAPPSAALAWRKASSP